MLARREDHKPLFAEVARVMETTRRWTTDKCDAMIQLFLHAIAVIAGDMQPARFSMPPDLDEVWHAAVLNTRGYLALCRDVCPPGVFLHHSTTTSADTRRAKRRRIRALYLALNEQYPHFNRQLWKTINRPIAKFQPDNDETMRIFVRMLEGTVSLRVLPSATIGAVKQVIETADGYDASAQRLIYNGKLLKNEATVAESGIVKETTLQLTLGLRGC